MASLETVHNTIRNRFATQVATPQGVEVQYDNAPFEPPEDTTWIRWTIRELGTEQRDFPSPSTVTYRTEGIATAQIFAPQDQGDKGALALARAVELAFRRVTDTGVRFRTPSPQPVGLREGYYQVNVVCPWWHDDVAA